MVGEVSEATGAVSRICAPLTKRRMYYDVLLRRGAGWTVGAHEEGRARRAGRWTRGLLLSRPRSQPRIPLLPACSTRLFCGAVEWSSREPRSDDEPNG